MLLGSDRLCSSIPKCVIAINNKYHRVFSAICDRARCSESGHDILKSSTFYYFSQIHQLPTPKIESSTSRCIFPTELICNILCYTHPQDIIRW